MRTANPFKCSHQLTLDAKPVKVILLLLLARLSSIVLPGEQLEAHRLRALVFNLEIACHRSRAYVEGMSLARSPIGQRPELKSRTIKLRLVSQYDGRASGGRDRCKSPL